jgi:hypothetical protein
MLTFPFCATILCKTEGVGPHLERERTSRLKTIWFQTINVYIPVLRCWKTIVCCVQQTTSLVRDWTDGFAETTQARQ